MVLLTSSTVTVLLSSALVTTFTFLLFLSGYVLQQQTVRSLQAALHPPPLPIPTLPVYFSDVDVNDTEVHLVIGETSVVGEGSAEIIEHEELTFPEVVKGSSKQEVLQIVKDALGPGTGIKTEDEEMIGKATDSSTQSLSDGSSTTVLVPSEDAERIDIPSDEDSASDTERVYPISAKSLNAIKAGRLDEKVMSQTGEDSSLGYIMLVPTPPLVCSAIMFFSHLSYSRSTITNRLILYPSFWEDSLSSDAYATALALLKQSVHEHNITVQSIHLPHDLDIEDQSSPEIEQAMLASISSADWTPTPDLSLSTLFYIRGPGLLLNAARLDSVLTSFTETSSAAIDTKALEEGWSPLPPSPVSASTLPLPSDILHPSHLLISLQQQQNTAAAAQQILHLPISEKTTSLVLNAMTSHSNHHVSEMEIEAQATGSGYVLFSEEELRHRRRENQWYGGVFERFERGRREVCPGGLDKVLEGSVEDGRRQMGRRERERDKARGW